MGERILARTNPSGVSRGNVHRQRGDRARTEYGIGGPSLFPGTLGHENTFADPFHWRATGYRAPFLTIVMLAMRFRLVAELESTLRAAGADHILMHVISCACVRHVCVCV